MKVVFKEVFTRAQLNSMSEDLVENLIFDINSVFTAMQVQEQFSNIKIEEKNKKTGDHEMSEKELERLKDVLKELKSKEVIVDPCYNKITNVRTKQLPNKNKACPCGKTNLRYKKCCEFDDVCVKKEMIEQLEGVIDKKAKKTGSDLIFV